MDAKESKNDMNIGSFFPQYSTTIFLHGFSASSHLVFLLVLSIFWAYKRRTMATLENSKPLLKNTYFLYYRSTLVSCICLSCCDLLLFMLNSLSGYKRGWPDLKLFAQFDFAFRTLTWFVISAYLCIHFSRSSDHRFPILLRIWWAFYFPMSCSSLVVHLDLYWKHLSLPFLLWIFDSISIISSLFFCYTGLFGKRSDDKDLHLSKPLLKSSFSQSNGDDRPGSSVSGENVSPYANASLLNMFTFSWIGPLLALGYKKTLNLEDIPQLATCENADVVFAYFVNKLESTSNGNDNGGQVSTLKLVKALILSSWKEILWTTLFSIICTLASYVVPSLINSFVKYLNSPRELKYKGYVLVFIFFLSKLIWCISERHLFFQLRKMAVKIRAALFSIIYKKGLRLSSQSKQGHTSGENINLMSVDVERTALFSWYLHNIWRVPVQIVLALLILYKYLGLASLVAVVATMILILANVPLGKLQEKFQGELMDSKDRRMKVASEALRNMRILKLHGWEMKFLAKITELRNFEIIWLKRLLYSSAMIAFVYLSAPMFVSMVTFGFCMLMRIPLDSGKILSALATFGILQKPIYSLPDTISMVVQTKVSLDRITSFLRLDDLNPNIVQKLPRDGAKVAIEIVKGNFSWDLHSSDLTLKDLNFRVYHGMRVAICGSIGSGKSSLLSCILGEVPKVSGTIKLNGTKAYVSQSPWIQSGKIVDNILFGKEMDNERYEMILEACSLKKDLELCAFGDHTIIGERGINLSGGQKQRIQIARALYHDADIYLLDDPFSAVDAHTGTHLFKISIDQSAVDISIPRQTEELLISIIGFLGTVAVMSQIAWQMLIVFIPMTVICIWYQVRYAPHLPLVLRGLTCTFPGGMKIGIVGRTGSGKSTLIHALFRMFEPVSGQILIDGIDISKIGLHDLRSKLSIIPQDPTMFEGTLRSNLDPLEEYTDEQIWEALDKCQLGDEVRKKERKLDSAVTENGENWSMGQRQLVCLGRVLLKRSKVLILDEATASVDTATDYQIQQTISQHFSGSTIITIAHRITTILDIDMVILMDNGLVLEYDSPAKLLQIKSSSFAKLVKEYTRRCS
ncbi:ABC transporter C family member 3-like isoform X2 [Macadamia integrifolia]|uniref:ABC transporter C family member 3-like isoform X2 n=1 Tax=Macadamia integrifolia TaxID=60698 RepID=UPI001C4F3748|nr:ABC transporter C family member 3-like isoform X2 [Macadamia integrifolia]